MKGYRLIMSYLAVVSLLLLLLLFSGCGTTRYVPVETLRTDTVFQSRAVRDSLFVRDSVYVKEWMAGDTVYVAFDRWHTKYVERLLNDTVYRSRVDSVAVPYLVEKELGWWDRQKIAFGEVVVVLLLVGIGVAAIQSRRQWTK